MKGLRVFEINAIADTVSSILRQRYKQERLKFEEQKELLISQLIEKSVTYKQFLAFKNTLEEQYKPELDYYIRQIETKLKAELCREHRIEAYHRELPSEELVKNQVVLHSIGEFNMNEIDNIINKIANSLWPTE